ncbi:MAG TPA: patatin-like phospholipase family protein [Vicinamibacteria bacterium]|nr:patatin-like phospholipase family protein [Vicinamibacteria bacterium]
MPSREYSPKRRTAAVFAGVGTAGAYHAGALRALDESGVKVDLVVGSGAGTIAAAFAAVAGGPKLYGDDGFWAGIGWGRLYRLRLGLRTTLALLAASYGVFLLPLAVALVAGALSPLVLIVDLLLPGLFTRASAAVGATPGILRGPYLAALAAPVFALCLVASVAAIRLRLRAGRRWLEALESPVDVERGRERLVRALWEIARGPTLSKDPPAEPELGKRYVALAAENLGQPRFRELILRAADVETGGVLDFVLLEDAHRTSFGAARARGPRSRLDGLPGAVDLRSPDHDVLFFDAVMTGLLSPFVAQSRRVGFPKGGLHGGEIHRLADATLAGGTGVAEALAAGAEQVILVASVSEDTEAPARRRGPRAHVDGALALLERQALEREIESAERINRMVQTLGHDTPGGRAWQDPATGRLFREFSLYVIRPARRGLLPLEWDGAQDPGTEVLETPADLMERGYKDAYRLFVEPVVGALPEPRRSVGLPPLTQTVGL